MKFLLKKVSLLLIFSVYFILFIYKGVAKNNKVIKAHVTNVSIAAVRQKIARGKTVARYTFACVWKEGYPDGKKVCSWCRLWYN